MSVESNIFSALSSLVGGRCFPDVAPQGIAAPYIVYQQAGGQAPAFLENTVPSLKNGRFQVSVWSQTREQASTLGAAVEVAMVAATSFQARPLSAPVSTFDFDTDLRGCTQDFTVWSQR